MLVGGAFTPYNCQYKTISAGTHSRGAGTLHDMRLVLTVLMLLVTICVWFSFPIAHQYLFSSINQPVVIDGGPIEKVYVNSEIQDKRPFDEIEYLPFKKENILDDFKSLPRLYIDLFVYRQHDPYLGLIDDRLEDELLFSTYQRIVDLFAQANIHVRIDPTNFLSKRTLSRVEAEVYLKYYGHLSSQESFKNQLNSIISRIQQAENIASDDVLGVQLLSFSVDSHPYKLSPWQLLNPVNIFPVYYFHKMNALARHRQIFVRSGNCHTRPSPTFAFRNETISLPKCPKRAIEALDLTSVVYSRLLSHELAHAAGNLQDGPNMCKTLENITSWDQVNLMTQHKYVGIVGHPCRGSGYKQEGQCIYLRVGQWLKVRRFLKEIDISPSPPISGATTIGDSTMQVGVHAAGNIHDMVFSMQVGNHTYNRKSASNGCRTIKSARVIVFSRLPCPVSAGYISRVRFMPSYWNDFKGYFKMEILVVRANTLNVYNIVNRSGIVEVHYPAQKMHIELETNRIPISQGEQIALSFSGLANVDTRAYHHDTVYADIVGPLRNFFEHAVASSIRGASYPNIRKVDRASDYFMVSDAAISPTALSFLTHNSTGCSEPIFNYDVVSKS